MIRYENRRNYPVILPTENKGRRRFYPGESTDEVWFAQFAEQSNDGSYRMLTPVNAAIVEVVEEVVVEEVVEVAPEVVEVAAKKYTHTELMSLRRGILEEIATGLGIDDPQEYQNKNLLATDIMTVQEGGLESLYDYEVVEVEEEDVKEEKEESKGWSFFRDA